MGTWRSPCSTSITKKFHALISPKQGQRILDYGCGSGEILRRFVDAGFDTEGCDISPEMVARTRLAGLRCATCEELLASGRQFDIILINNAFFYIHPFRWKHCLLQLRRAIPSGGALYLVDNPDLAKRHLLGWPRRRTLLTGILPVYQPRMGGFFVSARRLERAARRAGFASFASSDSFCNYRTHFILR